MATSGTYMTEVPLKGSAEKHYNCWKSKNNVFLEALGHYIQNITFEEGSIMIWNYTWDGKQEVFKERTEIDDETKALTLKGLEGAVMEQLKVYEVRYQFTPKTEDTCVCKITMIWEKRNDESSEPSGYMKFVKSMVVDMGDYIIKT